MVEPVELRRGVSTLQHPDDRPPSSPSASLLSTSLNLSNNIVGAGILSLPWCLRQASIVQGLLLIVIIGVLSGSSMVLIAISCERTGCYSFNELGRAALGPKFGIVLQMSMLVYTSLSCVSFLILAGDFFSGDSGVARGLCLHSFCQVFEDRTTSILFLATVVLLPLSCLRNLDALRYTSVLSMIGMVYLLLLLMFSFFTAASYGPNIKVAEPRWSLFSAAPVMNVAFIAHYNVPRFYEEMRERSVNKFAVAVTSSLSVCGIAYVGVALCGYLKYGDKTESDVLKNFDSDFKPAILGRLAMSAVVLFTYPLAFNSLRASAISLLSMFSSMDFKNNAQHLGLTFGLVLLTLVPGTLLDDIGVVLDYKGATLGGCIGFAYGAVIFLALFAPKFLCLRQPHAGSSEFLVQEEEVNYEILVEDLDSREAVVTGKAVEKRWKALAITFILWAIVSGVLGVTVTTIKLFND